MNAADEIKVGSNVIAVKNLPLALSSGTDINEGTVGVVKEVNQGGQEGYWLHVHFETSSGRRPRNCVPSEIELKE